MNGVRVDPAAPHGRAPRAAAPGRDLDHETQAFGLAVTGGLVSTTGIAGFTLGGGIGWLMRKHGLACDNLIGADVVTADGQLVHASADENPELFWALRGGGGNFGIVTSLEFRLHAVGPMVLAGPIFFAGERAEEVLRGYRDWVRELPDELTTLVNLDDRAAGAVPARGGARQADRRGGRRARRRARGGPRAACSRSRTSATRSPTCIGPMPYTAMQSLLDALWARGRAQLLPLRVRRRARRRRDRGDRGQHRAVPSPHSEIHVHHFGGAVARVGRRRHGVRRPLRASTCST